LKIQQKKFPTHEVKKFYLKNEKYFDFLKMDKKNVQKRKAKTLLTDEKFCLDG